MSRKEIHCEDTVKCLDILFLNFSLSIVQYFNKIFKALTSNSEKNNASGRPIRIHSPALIIYLRYYCWFVKQLWSHTMPHCLVENIDRTYFDHVYHAIAVF